MKRMLGTLAVLVLVTAGCGSEQPAGDVGATTDEQSSSTPGPGATPATAALPADSSGLVVTPGRIGDVKAGMSKQEALDTGFFDADVEGVEGCTFTLQWKKQFEGLDVLTREDGSIGALGVTKGGPRTSEGVGVGSTLAEVTAAHPGLSPVDAAGFDQAGAFLSVGEQHIGFLFGDATPSTIKQSSKVSFMEVTSGNKPDLMRDGC
jgi:hypothetical protein